MKKSDNEMIVGEEQEQEEIIPKLRKKGKQQKEKTSLSEAIQSILKKKIKKGHEANPIFSEFKKPFTKLKKEIEEKRKVQQKKLESQNFIKQFHIKPNFQKERSFENQLKRIAIKGVVNLYNQIKQFQNKQEA